MTWMSRCGISYFLVFHLSLSCHRRWNFCQPNHKESGMSVCDVNEWQWKGSKTMDHSLWSSYPFHLNVAACFVGNWNCFNWHFKLFKITFLRDVIVVEKLKVDIFGFSSCRVVISVRLWFKIQSIRIISLDELFIQVTLSTASAEVMHIWVGMLHNWLNNWNHNLIAFVGINLWRRIVCLYECDWNAFN